MYQEVILKAVKLDSLSVIPIMHLRAVFLTNFAVHSKVYSSKHFNIVDLANVTPE